MITGLHNINITNNICNIFNEIKDKLDFNMKCYRGRIFMNSYTELNEISKYMIDKNVFDIQMCLYLTCIYENLELLQYIQDKYKNI